MDYGIEEYIAQNSVRGFQRAYLFEYSPTFPGSIPGASDYTSRFLVRSTSIPGRSIEEIPIGWLGNDYKIAGRNAYDDFTVTFNVDEHSVIWQKFHAWMNFINFPVSPSKARAIEVAYMADQYLYLVGGMASTTSGYLLRGAWPKNMSAITLDHSTNDVAQFDLTFSYQYLSSLPL